MTFPLNHYTGGDAAFDPQHGVLFNKLGIADPVKLERAEAAALSAAYEEGFREFTEMHCFTERDIRKLHDIFLGEIYSWAGQYRNVDIFSDEIHWCRAIFVAQEMQRYGGLLAELTPFSPTLSDKDAAGRLARVHGELILIHPFRDGNGRLTRLLCDLLLVQAGRAPTHRLALVDEKHRATYLQTIGAFHFQDDLGPLTAFFEELLTRPA